MAPETHSPDILIVGAGIVGLSLALELRTRGASVTVLERGSALRAASAAAAGMLAAEDPYNPPALLALARLSVSLYPGFLDRLQALSGQAVPPQTRVTVQYGQDGGSERLREHSLDPRQLGAALLSAVRASGVRVLEDTPVSSVACRSSGVTAHMETGEGMQASQVVHATGAWSLGNSPSGGASAQSRSSPSVQPRSSPSVQPRKGQMLRVAMPAMASLREVHRAEHVYLVPRTSGPQAGTALIGATVEDAGFDVSTDPEHLDQLRAAAAALSPETAFAADALLVEAWAGLRPATPDMLPLLGSLGPREWIAGGHFRNGILLAPGTAHVLARLLAGESASIDLSPFAPLRFGVWPRSG